MRRLQPLRDRVARERWVAGEDVARNPFQAHIIELRVGRSGTYAVAFMYRHGTLFDIDAPEYLGRIADLPTSSQQVWVGTGIPQQAGEDREAPARTLQGDHP